MFFANIYVVKFYELEFTRNCMSLGVVRKLGFVSL